MTGFEVVDRARAIAAEHRGQVFLRRGHEDDGRIAGAVALADHLRRGEAVDARHLHVHEDRGEVVLQHALQRLLARERGHDARAQRAQDRFHRQQARRVVVDDEDACLEGIGDGVVHSARTISE